MTPLLKWCTAVPIIIFILWVIICTGWKLYSLCHTCYRRGACRFQVKGKRVRDCKSYWEGWR